MLLSITVPVLAFSSQAFSTHNLTKSWCHLTEDQNSVSVTHTLGTDGLCGLLMISMHIADLFFEKGEVSPPAQTTGKHDNRQQIKRVSVSTLSSLLSVSVSTLSSLLSVSVNVLHRAVMV